MSTCYYCPRTLSRNLSLHVVLPLRFLLQHGCGPSVSIFSLFLWLLTAVIFSYSNQNCYVFWGKQNLRSQIFKFVGTRNFSPQLNFVFTLSTLKLRRHLILCRINWSHQIFQAPTQQLWPFVAAILWILASYRYRISFAAKGTASGRGRDLTSGTSGTDASCLWCASMLRVSALSTSTIIIPPLMTLFLKLRILTFENKYRFISFYINFCSFRIRGLLSIREQRHTRGIFHKGERWICRAPCAWCPRSLVTSFWSCPVQPVSPSMSPGRGRSDESNSG